MQQMIGIASRMEDQLVEKRAVVERRVGFHVRGGVVMLGPFGYQPEERQHQQAGEQQAAIEEVGKLRVHRADRAIRQRVIDQRIEQDRPVRSHLPIERVDAIDDSVDQPELP